MSLELVTWDDAWEETAQTSISPKALKRLATGMRTETCGWVVSDNDLGILMIGERWPEDPNKAKYLTYIPHGMIVSRTKLAALA